LNLFYPFSSSNKRLKSVLNTGILKIKSSEIKCMLMGRIARGLIRHIEHFSFFCYILMSFKARAAQQRNFVPEGAALPLR